MDDLFDDLPEQRKLIASLSAEDFSDDDDGILRIWDWRLAEVLGFSFLPEIRRLTERHRGRLEKHGILCHRDIKSGRKGRPGTAYRYNFNQAILLVCKSDAQNAEPVQDHIITIYGLWATGKLRPVDAETETKVLNSVDRAFNAAPEVIEMLVKLAANDDDIKEELDGIKRQMQQENSTKRNDFSKTQCDLYARCLDWYYGGLDPAIGHFKCTDGAGHLLKHPAVEVDHYNGLRTDNRTVNGWPLSPAAHRRKTAGADFHVAFEDFQKKLHELMQTEADRQQQFKFEREDEPEPA